MSRSRRVLAAVVVLVLLTANMVAAAPASDGIDIEPALDGATAVRKGQAVDISGTVDLDGGSSFLTDAQWIGYDADGNEVLRADARFNLNRTEGDGGYVDIDPDGNVVGRLGLGCEFGDATSLPLDRVHPACTIADDGRAEDQTVTPWDVQLVLATPDATYHSDLLRVDPIPPVIEGFEVTSPTTVLVTVSEAVTHPTNTHSVSDWVFPDNEAAVLSVSQGTGDCEYAPDEDPRSGPDGCTFLLTVSPPLDRDATPRLKYEPGETRGKYVDGARNSMYLRSVEPTRGDRFDSLAADRVGPLPPTIDTIAGQAPSEDGEGRLVVLDNEPQPDVGVSGLEDGNGVEVQVGGTAAGTGTASGTTATVSLDAPLADGVHTLTATSSDTAACDPNDGSSGTCENPSEPSDEVLYDLDTVAPTQTGPVPGRAGTITVAFTEPVDGADVAGKWTVSNPNGIDDVVVTGVEDDGDGTASRRLTFTGGPLAVDAELTYTPSGTDDYQDAHTNLLAGFTATIDLAELPVATVEVADGDETESGLPAATQPVTFTIRLDEPVATGEPTATVGYRLVAQGTAEIGVDVSDTSGTADFDPGEDTFGPIEVEVLQDELDEFLETVVLELHDPSGLQLPGGAATSTATANVVDDDDPPAVSFQDGSPEVAEGESVEIVLELDGPSGKDITVDWETDLTSYSATEDDLPQQSGTVEIPAGETTGSFVVETTPDLEVDPGERFGIDLTAPDDRVTIGTGTVLVDIVDDDVLVPFASATGGEVEEDARGDIFLLDPGTLTFEVRLSEEVDHTVRVDYRTTETGTATPDSEFTPTSGTLAFEPGETALLVEVDIADDAVDEEDETVGFELFNPDGVAFEGGVLTVSTTGTIIDDDPLARAAFADGDETEEVSEGATAEFTVELDTESAKPIEIGWETRFDGTATDADAPAQSGTVTFDPGVTTATFEVTTTQDEEVEGDQDLSIVLLDPVNAELDADRPTVASLTILDDETVLPTLSMSVTDGNEGDLAIPPLLSPQVTWTLTLSEEAPADVTFEYATSQALGDATQESDYRATSGTATIPAGQLTVDVPVEIIDDALDEPDETVLLVVSDVQGARIAGGGSQLAELGVIGDDDGPVEVSIEEAVSVGEGEVASVDISLDAPSGKTVIVSYDTRDGVATTADGDYQATSGEVTFQPGDTVRTVAIQTLDDADNDDDESFFVDLTVETTDSATLGNSAAEVSILDDDLDPTGADPVVLLDATSVDEGDPFGPGPALLPTTTMTFDLRLSSAATDTVEVDWVASAAGATEGSDYEAASGTATIAQDDDSTTIEVGVYPDRIDEDPEGIRITLTAVRGPAELPGAVMRTGIINDDDPLASVGFVAESLAVDVDEGAQTTLDLELVGATEKDVTVAWTTSYDGAATTDDAPAQSGTVTFTDGVGTITLDTTQDALAEGDESFSVVLSSPSGAELDSDADRAVVTILDDEVSLPTLTVTGGEVDEGSGLPPLAPAQVVWTFQLDEVAEQDVTARFSTGGGVVGADKATAGDDYTADGGTVTIPAGETEQTVAVDVIDDELDEFIEEIGLVVDQVDGAALPGAVDQVTVAGRILDDDDPVQVSITEAVTVDEGDLADVAVTLSARSGKPITVTVETADDSATTGGGDYDAVSRQLTFPAGTSDLTQTVTIGTTDDGAVEGDEQFLVGLTVDTPGAATLGNDTTTVTIADNDALPDGVPVVSVSSASVDEGSPLLPGTPAAPTTTMTFAVSLNEAPDSDVTIEYRTVAGSAADGGDYVGEDDSITILSGQQSGEITIQVFADEVDEVDETFSLEITGVSGDAQLATGPFSRTGRILDDDALATVGFAEDSADVGVTEGGSVDLTVELEGATEKEVTVEWATSFGGAADAADAPAASGTVTLTSAEPTATITIQTTQDDLDEPTEDFQVVLSDPSNGALATDRPTQAVVNIADDDVVLPVLSVTGGTVDEGEAGTLGFSPASAHDSWFTAAAVLDDPLVFDVSLAQPAEDDVQVDWTTVDTGGSRAASAGSDYAAASGTLTIPAGETTAQIEVDVLDDDVDEYDEIVTVRFSNARGVVFAGGGSTLDAEGTISDDDPLAVASIGADVEVTEGEPASFEITLDTASGKDVQLRVRTVAGSATPGSDYTSVDRAITIPAGSTSTSVSVTTLDDSTFEPTEDLDVRLSVEDAETVAVDRTSAALTITDDDLGVDPNDTVVSLTGASVEEGDPLTVLPLPINLTTLDFVVRLSEPADGDVTIDYRTDAGTATAGDDFAAASGAVTIPDGEDEATVQVEVVADRLDEFDETLRLVLTGVTGDAVLPGGQLSRTGTIIDDDAPAQLRVSDDTVLEGDLATVDVTLNTPSGKDIEVDWSLVDGTATAGADFAPGSGTLSFPAGTTSRSVAIATLADSDTDELIEQFELVLSAPTNAGTDDGRGTISIVDVGVDGLPTTTAVFLEDVTVVETDDDRVALVPVRLSAASDEDVVVTWSSQRLTAAPGDDYVADGGQVTIAAGATSAQIPVTIVGDDEVEGNEDFLVLLTQAEGAVITGPTGRVTIEDDDEAGDGSGGGGGGSSGGGGGSDPDGAVDADQQGGGLADTGGGLGLVAIALAAMAARRRRED